MAQGATFTNPLPGAAIGDPFVLRHRGRFYLYGTNDGPPLADGRMIPVFRSDDLLRWEPLGGALEPSDPTADHWAPEVLAWNGRFFMVVSFGDVERRGHQLWVAVSDRPEGPFRLEARVSDPSERFSIDGSWLLDDDGSLYLFRCLDFVEEGRPPYGTGIVVQPMRDPLTPAGSPATVLRAHAPWHLFLANRTMPLYEGRTFAEWTTIEGPAPLRRAGRYFCGYSGGNYAGEYGTGEAVADAPLGPYTDVRGASGPIFGTIPGLVEGPGHFSVVRPDLVHDWIVLHGRTPGEPVRRVWLCPADWGRDGVTIGPLTTDPQPAPPLPDVLDRFDRPDGPMPEEWEATNGDWRVAGGELVQADRGAVAFEAWRRDLRLEGDWVVEAWVRFPGPEPIAAGLMVRGGGTEVSLNVLADEAKSFAFDGRDEREGPLPTLGGRPFDPSAFHALEIRARGGRAECRVDGVVCASGLEVPPGPARLGLFANGAAAFDAVAATSVALSRP